jgi:23S rRNA (pseudouridine1915-N3)-methyltransferase
VRLLLAAVGKPRNPGLASAIREYEERARRYWPLDVIEVREESARAGSAELVRRRESERLAEAAGDARLIACEVDGRRMTSEEFSSWLQRLREEARDAVFVIGGAYGLAPDLSARASARLSLSPWTLPHELARLVLVEQLYRAGTIVRGEPYHK